MRASSSGHFSNGKTRCYTLVIFKAVNLECFFKIQGHLVKKFCFSLKADKGPGGLVSQFDGFTRYPNNLQSRLSPALQLPLSNFKTSVFGAQIFQLVLRTTRQIPGLTYNDLQDSLTSWMPIVQTPYPCLYEASEIRPRATKGKNRSFAAFVARRGDYHPRGAMQEWRGGLDRWTSGHRWTV